MKSSRTKYTAALLIAVSLGSVADGVMRFNVASAADPSYAEAYRQAYEKSRAGDLAGARKALEEALPLAQTPVQKSRAVFGIGNTYFHQRQWEDARKEWGKMLEMTDTDSYWKTVARLSIMASYAAEGKTEQAKAETAKMMADNVNIQALSDYSSGALFGKDSSKIKADLLATIEKNPDPNRKSEAEVRLGEWDVSEKKFASARARFESAWQRKGVRPGFAAAIRKQVAQTYLSEKDYAHAKSEYEQVLAMDGANSVLKEIIQKQLKDLEQLEAAKDGAQPDAPVQAKPAEGEAPG